MTSTAATEKEAASLNKELAGVIYQLFLIEEGIRTSSKILHQILGKSSEVRRMNLCKHKLKASRDQVSISTRLGFRHPSTFRS